MNEVFCWHILWLKRGSKWYVYFPVKYGWFLLLHLFCNYSAMVFFLC